MGLLGALWGAVCCPRCLPDRMAPGLGTSGSVPARWRPQTPTPLHAAPAPAPAPAPAAPPLRAPQGQQHEQKRRQMGVADKAMYGVGQLVYQSAAARTVAFCYLVIMHTLVFASLSHVSHRTQGSLIEHHTAALVDHSHAARHDLTSMITHDGSAGAAFGGRAGAGGGGGGGGGGAAGAAAAGAAAAAKAVPKLLRRLALL
jgi:hypothetical protein